VQDIGFWLNGDKISSEDLSSENRIHEANLRLCSAIFFNFFNQVRCGINSKVLIEKCHFSESRNHSISLYNPVSAKLLHNSISKAAGNGIDINWLETSSWTENIRRIKIEGCDFQMGRGTGISI